MIAVVPHASHAVVAAEVLALLALGRRDVEGASDAVGDKPTTACRRLAGLSVTTPAIDVIGVIGNRVHRSNVSEATCSTKSTVPIAVCITYTV